MRSRYRSPLQDKFNELKKRGGTGKAIVAVARRMIELMYVLVKNKESYAFMDRQAVSMKLKRYGISSPKREVNGKRPVLIAGGINLVQFQGKLYFIGDEG